MTRNSCGLTSYNLVITWVIVRLLHIEREFVIEPSTPQSYSLESLLSGPHAQPWPDMPPEKFDAFKADIKNRGVLKPIDLTIEGFIFNGHQRCRALLALGRKRINADLVQIHPDVNAQNMMDYAIAINDQSRDITGADRATVMHARVRDGWNQRRIAKAFSVSQAAVSKLMAKYPPKEEYTSIVVSEDGGRSYVRTATTETVTEHDADVSPKNPWEYSGTNTRIIKRATELCSNAQEATSELDALDRETLRTVIVKLSQATEAMLAHLDGGAA